MTVPGSHTGPASTLAPLFARLEAWIIPCPSRKLHAPGYVCPHCKAEDGTRAALSSIEQRVQEMEKALAQACTNLAVLQPDLSREDTTVGFQADLWRDALLSGWSGPLGFDHGRRAALLPSTSGTSGAGTDGKKGEATDE